MIPSLIIEIDFAEMTASHFVKIGHLNKNHRPRLMTAQKTPLQVTAVSLIAADAHASKEVFNHPRAKLFLRYPKLYYAGPIN